jgi:muramidase (phage lysozyme)
MVIKADQLLNRPSGRLAMQKVQQEKMVGGASVNIVLTKKSIKNVDIIKTNVVKIESFFKGTLALDKKQLDDKKRDASKKRKEKIETKLETKPNAESGKISMPAAPRMGILDFIKNFIGNVLLGYFAVRLIKHLPKIVPIVKFLGNAADFIIDVGGKLLNGLVSFIDWGYKAYDATRGFIKNLGGENFAKGFDKFLGAIDTALFLTTALAGAMAVEALTGDGGDPNIKPKPGTGGRPKVTTSGGGGAGKPDIRNPLRQKPKVTTGGGSKLRLPKGLKARGGLLGLVFLIPDLIESGMLVSQGRGKDGIRTLISAVSGVAAGMAAYAGVIAGAAALGITGVGIPAAIALAVSGFGASYLAGAAAYNLTEAGLRKMGLVDNDPKTGKPYTYRSGGITRGGKSQRGARRTISKGSRGKYKRVVARKPGEIEIKPGADVGGEDKIFGIFPNPLKAAQRMVDAVNPFGVVKTAGEDLGKTDYFGPILAITSKITLGQKPSQRDYENVGLGINMLIAKGIQDKQLKGGVVAAFAEGGLVDPDVLSAAETGGDISNWVAKTFQGEIESNAQKTLRMIRENAEKKKTETTETPPSPEIEMETMTTGGGTADTSLNPHRRAFLDTLAYAEGTANYPNTGYNTMFTGKQFAEYKDHPRKIQVSGRYRSDAAGRYQFLSTTWDGLGLSDFSPANQDRGALKLLAPHVITAIDKGDFATAFHGARKTWASLPGAGYGQPEKKMKTLVGYANSRLEKYQKGQIGKPVTDTYQGLSGEIGGSGKFIQGNSGASEGIHFHIGPGKNPGSRPDPAYRSDARGAAAKALTYFIGQGKSVYDGRRGVYYSKGNYGAQVAAAQKAHEDDGGSTGGIDMQVGGAGAGPTKLPFPLKVSSMAYRPGGFGVSAKIDGSNSFVAHGRYDEKGGVAPQEGRYRAYAKGGETLNGPHLAMIGEKGREIVIDNDSVESHPQVKEMLLAINQASNYQGVLNAIRQYAPYDAMSPQTIFIPSPSTPEEDEYDSGMSGGVAFMPIGGGGDDPFATLYQGG